MVKVGFKGILENFIKVWIIVTNIVWSSISKDIFTDNYLFSLWNELVESGEVRCIDIDNSDGSKTQPSNEIFKLWIWRDVISRSDLANCLESVLKEQQDLCCEVGRSTKSAMKMKYRLVILERYMLAMKAESSRGSMRREISTSKKEKYAQENIDKQRRFIEFS